MKGIVSNNETKYGKMKLRGAEKLYALTAVSLVAFTLVFQRPYACVADMLMLRR
jgi:hypothetical protein